MTAYDLDRPHMIYQGELPPHLRRRPDAAEAAWDDAEDLDAAERFDWPSLLIIAAAVAVGIAIGVAGVLLLRPSQAGPAPEAPVPVVAADSAAAPAPAPPTVLPAIRTRPAVESFPPPAAAPIEARPLRVRPVAVAALPPTHASAPTAHAARGSDATAKVRAVTPPRAAAGCEAAGSRAEQAICADPALAAADQEMRRAYRHALDSGVAPAPLRASQEDWLIASEVAADRSPADLASAYRRRIAELNAVATREPPH